MFIDPGIGESITLDGKIYNFTEAPNAPGIIYAEIGRKAKVYRVVSSGQAYALKAFKPKYRSTETVENTQRIAVFQDVPGLSVARRLVINPEAYPDVVGRNEAFAYAILMPWVEGKSWFNYVTGKVALDRQECLQLARSLANAVCELEQRDLAHCDLSSSNFIFSSDFKHVELIDIEDMFGHDLEKPDEKPKGTGGYAPEWVKKDGVWEAGADRYSTGILLSEILGWQFEDIRAASAGDAYFADGEFGNKSKRFRMMSEHLNQVHPELSRLFKTVWYAESVEECPRVVDWKQALDSIREPELQVSPDFLKFGTLDLSVKPVRQPQVTLKVRNIGGGVLAGHIRSNVPWLSVSPTEFSCPEGQESKHKVTLGSNAPRNKGRSDYQFSDGVAVQAGQIEKNLSGSYSVILPKSLVPVWLVIGILLLATIIGASLWGGGAQLAPPTPVATSRLIDTSTFQPTDLTSLGIDAGSTRLRSADGATTLLVPAGSFIMGSNTGNPDEQPAHTVSLDAFWIDRTEVTNAMFDHCVQAGVCQPPENTSSYSHSSYYGNSQFADYPVINQTWDSATTYCLWVGARLPTEAEWEKAARGMDERMYPWGNEFPTCSLANSWIGDGGCVGDTNAVGSYPAGASPYGALDLAGNAWEWVNDWYNETYYSQSPADNPQGPPSGDVHVLRGGSFFQYDRYISTTARLKFDQSNYYDRSNSGFRCASSTSTSAIVPNPTATLPVSTPTNVTGFQYFDDFSSYSIGTSPAGWLLRGESSILPVIAESGGTGPAHQAVSFPEVGWQYWDKWLLKDGLEFSGSYTVTVKMNFQNDIADRAGITIAWNDTNWDRIDIQPNVYTDSIEFRITYGGPIHSSPTVETVGSISINAYNDYWLKVVAEDNGPAQGQVTVYWSTDGFSFKPVVIARGLANLSGFVGVGTAGPHLPAVIFDDFKAVMK